MIRPRAGIAFGRVRWRNCCAGSRGGKRLGLDEIVMGSRGAGTLQLSMGSGESEVSPAVLIWLDARSAPIAGRDATGGAQRVSLAKAVWYYHTRLAVSISGVSFCKSLIRNDGSMTLAQANSVSDVSPTYISLPLP